MPSSNSEDSTNDNEQALLHLLKRIARGIVRARACGRRREVRWRNYYTGLSVACTILGAAGLIKTKVDNVPAAEWSWVFVGTLASLAILLVMEAYRAFGVEKTALNIIAATRAFKVLELDVRHALEGGQPFADVEKCREKSRDLEKMFIDELPDPAPDSAEYAGYEAAALTLASSWILQQKSDGGLQLPQSQQRPKRRGGNP